MPNHDTENHDPAAADRFLEVTIEKLVTGGEGLARLEGQAIFVPLAVPGDKVRVRVSEQRKGFIRAEVAEVITPGPGRREAPCPHFGDCGGCDLQHLDNEHQRTAKRDIVLDCFQRLGKLDLQDLITGPEPGPDLGYRNRIRLVASAAGPYGLLRRGSHDVVPLTTCPIMPERFNRDILPWLRMLPPVDQIVVRLDGHTGDDSRWLISLYGPPNRLKVLKKIIGALGPGEAPAPGCVGLMFNNLPVWGRNYLLYQVAGHTFRAGAQSFFQGNLQVTEQAVAIVRTWLGELRDRGELGSLLGDLFCGVGLFSLTLADMFDRVIAIDSDAAACRDAQNNVHRDEAARGKVSVHTGPLAKVLREPNLAAPELWRQGLCVVDPPRRGLEKEGIAALLQAAPRHILYMSCDPATLARDTARLAAVGYEPRHLQVLDMFPQTAHIESLLLLAKQD